MVLTMLIRQTFAKRFVMTVLAAGLMTAGLGACKHEEPNTIYMPDMVYSPALKAQKEGSMRMPVRGTIPRDYEPYPYKDLETAGRELKNPLRPTHQVMMRGQAIYNTYCIVCHGPNGEGDGTVVPRFPRPPTLQSDKIRGYQDGSIYHVITMGQNLMPSYASQISSGDRWAAIHYIRALQRAKHPTPEDLKAAAQE
jgi:mono/diheme cytochrome c family protein